MTGPHPTTQGTSSGPPHAPSLDTPAGLCLACGTGCTNPEHDTPQDHR